MTVGVTVKGTTGQVNKTIPRGRFLFSVGERG